MSVRIAICDSSAETAVQLEDWLRKYCSSCFVEPFISRFTTPASFIDAIALCRFDALFFAKDGPEGFLSLRGVREKAPELPIVFITDTDRYAVTCFRLHLTDYVIRPTGFKNVARAMRLLGVGSGE